MDPDKAAPDKDFAPLVSHVLRSAIKVTTCALIIWAQGSAFAATAGTQSGANSIVHMLDYVGVDYAATVTDRKVVNPAEYQEQREFIGQVVAAVAQLPSHEARDALLSNARELRARIEAKDSGDAVASLAAELRKKLVHTYDIAVAPKAAPDLRGAAALFTTHCAACHGPQGRGDGPAGKGMNPAPSNFHNTERLNNRSLYSLYSTITLGVKGTPMPGFNSISDEQRWALAFYVGGLRSSEQILAMGEKMWRKDVARDNFSTLKDIAFVTGKEVADTRGADAAATLEWLTRNPAELARSELPLAYTRRLLGQSVETYRKGDRESAQKQAIAAYLEGFEPAEASLDAADRALRQQIEAQMMKLRGSMREGASADDVGRQAETIRASLELAQQRMSAADTSPAATAFSAFIILLREGLEALLVVATIVALLAKAGRRDAMQYIHIGWISAVLLGIATWFVASFLISVSGASREMTEGIAALFSAAILIYVGFWLHSKAYAQRWQHFIEAHLTGALSKGTLWALASVSFIAAYREIFETVLFYEALWAQAGDAGGPAIIGGVIAAAATLGITGWLIFRSGMRLPIGPFFAVSSTLLALLAVIFVGQGIAALQEAGTIDTYALDFPTIPMLGIHPTWQSLLAQLCTLTIVVFGFVYGYLASQRKRPG